mgnify:CR=1 FL=1
MKKEDKEKLITELRHKYIGSLDNYTTTGFYQRLGFLGAIITGLISFDLLKIADLNSTGLFAAFLFLIYILHLNNQYSKYVDDLYEDLLLAIKTDKILRFKIKNRNWLERNIFYKKRYK